MKKKLLLVIALIIFLPVAGCGSPDDGGIEIKPAPIHEVSITFAKSLPPQVIVYIKGGLPDSCTTFHGLSTQRDGSIVSITVTVQRPRAAICAEVYGFFEKTENLGWDFTSGETYLVKVNNVTETFTMP
jgi:hypothetical protein